MEHAPLRPVPKAPAGPVEPAAARDHVAAHLPGLDQTAASALAHVALVGRPRPDVAAELELGAEELARALARGRKALRRALFPLPGSGWCERAERLISDRLDGELRPPGPRLLEVHLGNCPRCVEHELRLVQATDTLAAGMAPPPPAEAPPAEPYEAPALRIVEPEAGEQRPTPPWEDPGRGLPPWAIPGEPKAEHAPVEEPEAEERELDEPEVAELEAPPPEVTEPEPPAPELATPPEPRPSAERRAASTGPAPKRPAASASNAAWTVLFVIAVVLTLLALGITVVGVLGGSV